jgi:DNA-directed RNA polymerase subunit RPC12/RpoP
MHGTTTTQFNCVDCNALYHLIKVEAGPETVDRELNCQACGARLPARDGQFVLKYFLLRKPSRRQKTDGAADDSY